MGMSEIKSEFVHWESEFEVITLMGSLSLAYGTERKKRWKAISFGDTTIARQVAKQIIAVADAMDKVEGS